MKQKGVTKQKGTKALKDRIHQHLSDKNDVITEDDMKNIKTGEDAFQDEPETKKALSHDIKDGEKLADVLEEKKQTSPWNILSGDDK
ncbi:MAG: hypothetical protein ABIR18_11535 [Chitinophagaceae bacterium]